MSQMLLMRDLRSSMNCIMKVVYLLFSRILINSTVDKNIINHTIINFK